jgi:hypothetical protein
MSSILFGVAALSLMPVKLLHAVAVGISLSVFRASLFIVVTAFSRRVHRVIPLLSRRHPPIIVSFLCSAIDCVGIVGVVAAAYALSYALSKISQRLSILAFATVFVLGLIYSYYAESVTLTVWCAER